MSPSLVEERNHPNHWYNRAMDLHAAAGAVRYAMGDRSSEIAKELGFSSGFSMGVACQPVYYMLCGLALEVIMKAVLVQRGIPAKKYETHSFETLTRLLGLRLTDKEKDLLVFYEAWLVWAGRYPTPRNATDEKIKDFYSLAADILTEPVERVGGITLRRSSGAGSWDSFTSLWRTYSALFEFE